jgi:hypothetical protein
MKKTAIALIALTAALGVACKAENTAEPQGSTHPPMTMPGPGMGQGAPATGATITYQLPRNWQRQQPQSSMRIDQAAIPGQGGSGELAVFFFGPGGGGTTESNLQRWAEQMGHPGMPPTQKFEANGYQVTWLDLRGTLQPSTTGMGPATDQPGSRMFAAVVEGEGGPWFFKATGPEETMGPERDNFLAMIQSVQKAQAL